MTRCCAHQIIAHADVYVCMFTSPPRFCHVRHFYLPSYAFVYRLVYGIYRLLLQVHKIHCHHSKCFSYVYSRVELLVLIFLANATWAKIRANHFAWYTFWFSSITGSSQYKSPHDRMAVIAVGDAKMMHQLSASNPLEATRRKFANNRTWIFFNSRNEMLAILRIKMERKNESIGL